MEKEALYACNDKCEPVVATACDGRSANMMHVASVSQLRKSAFVLLLPVRDSFSCNEACG